MKWTIKKIKYEWTQKSGNKQKKEEIQFNKKYIFKTILKCFKILNI